MVSTGNKAKRLSSVNHTGKSIQSTERLVRTIQEELNLEIAKYVDRKKKRIKERMNWWQITGMARKGSSWATSEGSNKFRKALQVDMVEKHELICAAQEQDLRTSSVKHGIDKTQASSVCRLSTQQTFVGLEDVFNTSSV